MGIRGRKVNLVTDRADFSRGYAVAEGDVATTWLFNPETGIGAVVFANSMDTDWTMDNVVADLTLHLMAWFE